jgi:hypothetical protein
MDRLETAPNGFLKPLKRLELVLALSITSLKRGANENG